MTDKFSNARIEKIIEDWLLDAKMVHACGAGNATEQFLHRYSNVESRRRYQQALRNFIDWLQANEIATFSEVTTKHIGQYIGGIEPKRGKTHTLGVAGSMQRKAHTVICNYFDALMASKILTVNKARAYKLPRNLSQHCTPADALSPTELSRMFEVMKPETPLGQRDCALIAFLLGTACRIAAALKLTHRALQEVDGRRVVVLHEKGNVKRTLTLNSTALQYLDPYLDGLASHHPDLPVFRSWDTRKRELTDKPMRYLAAYNLVRKAADRAGVRKLISPHSFRASSITRLLEAGHPLEVAQRIAGHADVKTTKRYHRISKDNQENAVDMDILDDVLKTQR